MKAAVLGYGTVGGGVVEVLFKNKDAIASRVGEEIEVKYILDIRTFPGDPFEDKITNDFNRILEDEEVKIPTELGGHEVTMILKGAFSGQTMRSVELPDGLTQIGANPFAYCTELAEFRISPYHENFAVIDGVLFEKSSRRLISYPQAEKRTRMPCRKGSRRYRLTHLPAAGFWR